MNITEIRIYAEVLEQGLDFRSYVERTGFNGKIKNCYTKKAKSGFSESDSIIDRIRKVKDVDVLISAISNNEEYPLLMIEYSTAVPTDDHRMQRSDVYYWGGKLKVPVMKISSTNKGMNQSFGGGDRITNEQEQRLAYDHGAIFYPIKWDTLSDQDILPTKPNALSCIPFHQGIQNIIQSVISAFQSKNTFDEFYRSLQISYQNTNEKILADTPISVVHGSIVNSTRFFWDKDKLSVKINRFGHALDPERGVLYFANMLVGAKNTITEIQVNRSDDIESRGGYKSLFDGLTHEKELLQYVLDIINYSNNEFTDENALHILTHGLNIDHAISFDKAAPHEYRIADNKLRTFLFTHKSIVAKTIFFLSTELRLTDKNRDTICTITWNETPILEYLSQIYTDNRMPVRISPLTIGKAKEDIITFASVELYKKMQFELLAVSYPGAQGDRCILKGAGRKVLRTYVDIIAYKSKNNEIQVFLEECKDQFSKSQADVDKLNALVADDKMRDGLELLFKKTIRKDNICSIYTSVAAKEVRVLPRFLVDYIFMFTLSSDQDYTYIDYTVALVNTTLVPAFKPLENRRGCLVGRLKYNRFYIID